MTGWAVAHLAGGLIELDADRALYNAVLARHLRYDNVVHFVGFGVAGVAAWEAIRPRLLRRDVAPLAARVTVWLFGMGIGALNEVLEFAVALNVEESNVEESNVGGYLNTGRNLIAKMLGAAAAAWSPSAGSARGLSRPGVKSSGRSREAPGGTGGCRRRPR